MCKPFGGKSDTQSMLAQMKHLSSEHKSNCYPLEYHTRVSKVVPKAPLHVCAYLGTSDVITSKECVYKHRAEIQKHPSKL